MNSRYLINSHKNTKGNNMYIIEILKNDKYVKFGNDSYYESLDIAEQIIKSFRLIYKTKMFRISSKNSL